MPVASDNAVSSFELTLNGQPVRVARTTTTYSEAAGLPIETVVETGGAPSRTLRTFDDVTGLVLTIQRPNQVAMASGRVTRFTYDTHKLYPARTVNELGHIAQEQRDPGTGTVVREVGKPIAGKTGTTNDEKDVWFIGYSPDMTVGVFIGYDKPRHLGRGATGGQIAAPIVKEFLKTALADKPAVPFRVPPGIKLIRIDARTGMRATAGDSRASGSPSTASPRTPRATSSRPRPTRESASRNSRTWASAR